MKKSWILFVVMLAAFPVVAQKNVKQLNAIEFSKQIADKKTVLVDVRTPEEFAAGHIAGAINIDVNDPDFPGKILASTKSKSALAIYCRSGRRSKYAITLIPNYKGEIYELSHGITEWLAQKLPVVK